MGIVTPKSLKEFFRGESKICVMISSVKQEVTPAQFNGFFKRALGLVEKAAAVATMQTRQRSTRKTSLPAEVLWAQVVH